MLDTESYGINPAALPLHVGIIMDGNGRWAKKRNLPRTSGHSEGLKAAKSIVKTAADLGIKNVTLYVFSTENWKRTQQETGFLMNLIHTHLCQELQFYKDKGIRVRLLGDITGLGKEIQKDILQAEADTKNFTGLALNLAINYGGRDEIVRGIRKALAENVQPENFTESLLPEYFDIPTLPDVDLLIRTGGEKRLSNFMLWHCAYAELLFSDTLWPDYDSKEFLEGIAEYQKRTRRFGAVPV